MSETKQTRCPFCSSVFNITTEQLAARGGHVRCGGCLQVFRADQHIVTGEAVVTTSTKATSAPVSQVPTNNIPVVARTQSATGAPTAPAIPAKKLKTPDDESWAMNLLGEDLEDELQSDNPNIQAPTARMGVEPPKSAPVIAKKPMFDDEISDMLHESWLEPTTTKDHLKSGGEVDKIKASADESWAQALMSDLEEEEKKEQAKNHSMDLIPTKAKISSRKADAAETRSDNTQNKSNAKTGREANVNAPKNAKEDDLLNFLNSNSAPTINQRQASLPLEIKNIPMISINWGYWLTWTILCSGAVLLLLTQYIYFNFNSLALNTTTRPKIVQVCATLGCKVPEQPNIDLLIIKKLVIRKHPDVQKALQVDAIVFNEAQFAQPLPALKLSFMNLNNKVTASRVLQPKEYLQIGAKSLRRIPPETPIHIELAIVKPNVEITRYRLQPLYK